MKKIQQKTFQSRMRKARFLPTPPGQNKNFQFALKIGW
jgi:hypothetical protein